MTALCIAPRAALALVAAAILALGPTHAHAQAAGVGLPADIYDPTGAAATPTPEEVAALQKRKLAKAEQILSIALPKTRLAEMLGALRPELEKQLRDEAGRRGKDLTPAIADKLVGAMETELNMLYAALFPNLPPVYADAFSEAELDKLLDLYASPEGRSLLAKLDPLALKLAEAMEPYIAIYRNRLRARVKDELEKLD